MIVGIFIVGILTALVLDVLRLVIVRVERAPIVVVVVVLLPEDDTLTLIDSLIDGVEIVVAKDCLGVIARVSRREVAKTLNTVLGSIGRRLYKSTRWFVKF